MKLKVRSGCRGAGLRFDLGEVEQGTVELAVENGLERQDAGNADSGEEGHPTERHPERERGTEGFHSVGLARRA